MIKYILPLLLLIGCSSTIPDTRSPSEIPHEVPRLTEAWIEGIKVSCLQREVNTKLVWQECSFTNDSPNFGNNICIALQYFQENDGIFEVVATSRPICSHVMPAWTTRVNYLAFTKTDRQKLNACGCDLKKCFTLFQITKL